MYLPKRSRLVLREISGTVHILRIMESVLGDKLLFKMNKKIKLCAVRRRFVGETKMYLSDFQC